MLDSFSGIGTITVGKFLLTILHITALGNYMHITKTRHFSSNCTRMIIIVMVSLYLVACEKPKSDVTPQAMMPPPSVTVEKISSRIIDIWEVFTGRLESAESVDLRARVSGYIQNVVMKEGALVNKGDLLFNIDDRELKIEVKRLEALLVSSQAQIDLAIRNLDRAKSLKETNSISQSQLEVNNTQLIKANSDYDNVLAALESAKLSLSFARVTAPISGQVSRANITAGNYVTAGEQVLTSIVSIDVIHAYFDVDEQTFSGLTSLRESLGEDSPVIAEMQLLGEEGFKHKGKVDFIDNKLDPNTGSIRLRAMFKKQKYEFLPGMFARVRLKVQEKVSRMMIDEKAISTDLSHKYVLVVGENNVVEYRPVILGKRIGNLRIVTSGLKDGDTIIVDGVQRARPGTPVTPTETEEKNTHSYNQI
ncbi:MAG: multidrug efflux system membrane fusion protein [Oleiphilaceae bacterium]|jgi:multidrug efflux system membrane fusion protein